ncbi:MULTISPECIES: metal-dependent hydrolase [Yersinia]|uniref:metal-dependent hydrolase n=1 Tax=Yersinia TaxID=629 RepID=UPI0005DB933C|nr:MULTISPECIES: metal-dependent hydrolase [Yersinia]CNL28167.1 metal-dependent hydrolase%2C membrane-bound [Yersinia frederiksenii]
MPTIITHAAVPLCIGVGLGKKTIPPALLLTGIVFSIIPDLDVLSFKLGIAYANAFGHRGFTHSLLFAFSLPALALLFRRYFNTSFSRIGWFLTLSLLSHSVLDSLTTGGMGVGWLWPWSQERFFAPVQVIKVAPFQLGQYFKPNGIAVIKSELWWVWGPGVILMLSLMMVRMIKAKSLDDVK